MGFFKNIGKTISNVVKNPVKAISQGDFLTGVGVQHGGIVGGMLANKLQKSLQAPLPQQQYFGEPREIQDKLINNQMSAADKYSKSLADQVNSEVGVERAALEPQVQQAQRDARGSANSRGMLFSGRRIKAEGDIANEATGRLADARSNAIQKALNLEQSMYAQPLQSRANIAETNMNQQGLLDKYKQETQAKQAQLMAGGMGLIGQGLGQGIANKRAGYSFGYNG